MHNLASLPHITVAGAIATATHGSGVKNGNLATAVAALEIVTADETAHASHTGKRWRTVPRRCRRSPALWGVVTRVTLNLVPTFQVAQSVYQNVAFDHLEHHFDEIFGSGYSVSLFTDWQNHHATQVWIKRRLAPGNENKWQPELFGAKLATEKLSPHHGSPRAESCTEQPARHTRPVARKRYRTLVMDFTPSSGQELQTEYFVPHHLATKRFSPSRSCATASRHICSSQNCAPSPPTICG